MKLIRQWFRKARRSGEEAVLRVVQSDPHAYLDRRALSWRFSRRHVPDQRV